MRCIRGKSSLEMDMAALAGLARRYREVHIDIGTGDGRYVARAARACPQDLVIGIDACAEGMQHASRRASSNALYVVANALALPMELTALGARLTINFPWGSLLSGLLGGDPCLLNGLGAIARPGATLELRLNTGALAEAGHSLESAERAVLRGLCQSGWEARPAIRLDREALRACPTSWARRLAFGRDPRGIYLRAVRSPQPLERRVPELY